MIHLQIVSRDGENLQTSIRSAISEGQIRSFEVVQVKGGLIIRHKRHVGVVAFERTSGPLLATIKCNNRKKEWQLLEALVGRLAYHFKNEVSAVNIQFEPDN